MKKAVALLLFLTLAFTGVRATHIYGGEISVQWVSGNTFHVTVNFYRDCTPGTAAFPASLTFGAYDLVTNASYSCNAVTLDSNTIQTLQLGDSCYTPANLCVQKAAYEKDIVLADNPHGYYISYALCCRSSSIVNIQDPDITGSTWYTTIPDPALHNSSPVAKSYPRSYFCVNNPNTDTLAFTDVDGDSLLYSLITPFDGLGGCPDPGPYANIVWNFPYSAFNMVGGSPAMAINRQTGVLTAKPPYLGIFVFSVRVEEWKRGANPVKLGEVRRNVQYTVQDCDGPDPVVRDGNSNLLTSYTVKAGDTLNIDVTVNDSAANSTLMLTAVSSLFTDGSNVVFTQPVTGKGKLNSPFTYMPVCNDTGMHRVTFTLIRNSCYKVDTLKYDVDITVLPPDVPTFSVPFTFVIDNGDSTVNVTINSGESVTINAGDEISGVIVANNVDPYDDITLVGVSDLFNGSYDASFAHVTGYSSVQSALRYGSACKDIRSGAYHVAFTVNHCYAKSTFDLDIIVKTSELDPIPNIFTPNGDKKNDYFQLKNKAINFNCDFSIKIFDRWGLVLFESTDANFRWDGTTKGGSKAAEGVYYYIIESHIGAEEYKRKGTVNIKF